MDNSKKVFPVPSKKKGVPAPAPTNPAPTSTKLAPTPTKLAPTPKKQQEITLWVFNKKSNKFTELGTKNETEIPSGPNDYIVVKSGYLNEIKYFSVSKKKVFKEEELLNKQTS